MATKITTPKKAEPKPAAERVELLPLVVEAMKAEGVKLTVRWSPTKAYASLLDGKTNIAYAFAQTRTGLRIVPALPKGKLPKGAKGFRPYRKGEGRFASMTDVVDVADVARIVPVLKAAADAAKAKRIAAQVTKPARKGNGKGNGEAASAASRAPVLTEAEQAEVDALAGVELADPAEVSS